MHDSLTPRPWRPEDDVRAHVRRVYEEFHLAFDDAFEGDLADVGAAYAGGAFWVIDGADGILATAGVMPHGAARIVKRIYVAPAGRRLGLARLLLRRCAAFGAFAFTELWSDVRFRGAHQLYLSEGFRMGPTRVLADPDRSVERYFRKC